MVGWLRASNSYSMPCMYVGVWPACVSPLIATNSVCFAEHRFLWLFSAYSSFWTYCDTYGWPLAQGSSATLCSSFHYWLVCRGRGCTFTRWDIKSVFMSGEYLLRPYYHCHSISFPFGYIQVLIGGEPWLMLQSLWVFAVILYKKERLKHTS